MKSRLLTIAIGFALISPTLTAAPLQRSQVSADAKWLLHLDVEALQKSKLGAFLLEKLVKEAGDGLKAGLNIDLPTVIAQTGSLTAYGKDFSPGMDGSGVLILQGSKTLEQVLTGLLVQQAEASKAGEGMVKIVREGVDPIYEVGGKVLVTIRPGRGILASPKLNQMEDACRVMDSQATSLADSAVFSEYAELPGGFIFLALAEGFARDAGLPAQAQVLKLAEGGRAALSEEADKLRLLVNLKAQTAEGATQIQQVLQGLVALASLTKVDEPELARMQEWVRAAQVKANEKMVSLDLSVPVAAALKQWRDPVSAVAPPQKQSETSPTAPAR